MSNAVAQVKTNAEYTHLLEKIEDMPTLPVIVLRVNELLADPNATAAQVAEVLNQDQVLTAKVLKLANSSYYAIPGGVKDVKKALSFLGFNTVAQLTLGLSCFSMFKPMDGKDFTMADFWQHASGSAICARVIAKHVGGVDSEEAFTCGLLHDIGKLVMNQIDEEKFIQLLHATRENEASFVDLEQAYDTPGHSFLGEKIAEKWGLPQNITMAVKYHHYDVSGYDTLLPDEKKMVQIVRLANAITLKHNVGKSGDYSKKHVNAEMLTPFSLELEGFNQIEEKFKEDLEKAGDLLSVFG